MNTRKIELMLLMSFFIFISLTILNSDKQFNGFLVLGQNVTLETNIAEKVHETETLEILSDVDLFVILIANEAHESWNDERHKLLTDKNAYYVPSNLILHEGTRILFLNADAPWDTPHPHNIELVDIAAREVDSNNDDDSSNNRIIYSTGILEYTEYSEPVLLEAGQYTIENLDYETKVGTITILEKNQSNKFESMEEEKNLTMGAFYTPTYEVENNMDNDGNIHPGSLSYFRDAFQKYDFRIVSEYNFTYAECDYCPGNYWPDNKSANHTLIIYETNQPFEVAMDKLREMVRDNVYI